MLRSKHYADGHQTICRACNRESLRRRYRRGGAARRAQGRVYAQSYRERNSNRSPDEVTAARLRLRPDGVKRCRQGHLAPLAEFRKNSGCADGLADTCRACHSREVSDATKAKYQAWFEAMGFVPGVCYTGCGREATTADHLVPRNLGGPDVAENCAPMCQSCNAAKNDNDPWQWLTARELRANPNLDIAIALLSALTERVVA